MYVILYMIGGDLMHNTNVTTFRKNIFSMLEQTVKYNEPVNISTKDGNAVVISEEDYRGLMETLHLVTLPGMKEKLQEGQQTPLSDCLGEDEVDW
jgi:PHD/YefM family antitoxin component YafN of YafNO toxin-antitoxin module